MDEISLMLTQKLAEVEKELTAKKKEVEKLEKLRSEILDLMHYKRVSPQESMNFLRTKEPKRSASRKERQVQMLFKLVPELIQQSASGYVKAGEIIKYVQDKEAIIGEGATTRIRNILFACAQRSDCPFSPVLGKKGYYRMK